MGEQLLDRERIRSLFDLRGDTYATRAGSFDVDPYPTFSRLRESGPVHPGIPHEELGWTGEVMFEGLPYPNRRHFTAYDFETCSIVLRDERRFVTNPEFHPGDAPMPDSAILFMDGERHRSYRRLVQPSFAPAKAIWWLENWVRSTIDRLIDTLVLDDRADLNLDFCAPIPLLTITGSLGITVEQALEVRAAVTSDGQDVAILSRLLLPIIAARRTEPEDDLISVLVEAEVRDEEGVPHRLSDVEILAFGLLLLAAGSGTTWKQMGITLVALAQPSAGSRGRPGGPCVPPACLRGVRAVDAHRSRLRSLRGAGLRVGRRRTPGRRRHPCVPGFGQPGSGSVGPPRPV